MNGWDNFGKYIGVDGVLALLMTAAVVAGMFVQIEVPKEAWGLLGVAWGAYFRRNGNNVVKAVKGKTE